MISRSVWGAKHAPTQRSNRPVMRVVIHHTYRPDIPEGTPLSEVASAVQGIERHHVQVNGWAAIGYNWLIDQDGRIYQGRGWGMVGAHAAGINSVSVGICFLIDGGAREPSAAAWGAADWLIREGIRLGEIEPQYVLTGHRDHAQTTCPGDRVYASLDRLRALLPWRTQPAPGVYSPEQIVPRPPEISIPARDYASEIRQRYIPVPARQHVTEIARVRRVHPDAAAAGLGIAEYLARAVSNAQSGPARIIAKQIADALADEIKRREAA